MKKSIKNRKNKLVKSTTFFMALFVMAIMLLSSTVPAAFNTRTSEPIKANQNIFQAANTALPMKTAVRVSTQDINAVAQENSYQPLGREITWIHYDDGTPYNALGLTSGGTFEQAVRFTSDELGDYAGFAITNVQVHQGSGTTAEPSHDININIYGAGTSTAPGALLLTEAFTTAAGNGFQTFTLSGSVFVSGDADIWVAIEWLNTLAGQFPAGMDAGPALDTKSDWFNVGGSWVEVQIYGFDYNNMVWAGVEPGGPLPEHDMKMVSIDSPVSGGAAEFITPKVTVKNVGNNTETDVPVNLQISQPASVNILYEGFEGTTFPPTGWTTYGTATIARVTGGKIGTYAAKMSSYGYGYYGEIDTPSFDGSSGGNVLTFWHKQLVWAGDQDNLYVLASNDGGMSYTPIVYYGSSMDWTFETINLDDYIAPTSAMQVWFYAFCDYGYGVYLDEITISAVQNTVIYDDTQIIPSIASGATAVVEFNDWTPAEWGDSGFEDSNVDFNIEASTQLVDDVNPTNDIKTGSFTLYFPFLQDVTVDTIISPTQSGLGTTFPVKVKISNVGQEPVRNFFTEVNIGSIVMGPTLMNEQFSSGIVPPTGWVAEPGVSWYASYSANAGGTSPEAYLPYYYCVAGAKLITSTINVAGYSGAVLNFKTYINHWSGTGMYTLKAAASTDNGATWTEIWSWAPSASGKAEVSVPIPAGSATTKLAWYVIGNPYYFNYWYLDDISVQSTSIVPEYTEDQAVTAWFNPGQSLELTYPSWTPAQLAIGTSGEIDYGVAGESLYPTDSNPANDVAGASFTLTFLHDVGVKITGPARDRDTFYAFEAYPTEQSFSFDSATPGITTVIAPSTAGSFISAGTWADGQWYASAYYGGFYSVDPETGAMTLIGSSITLNGMAYDDTSSTMYAIDSYNLYTLNMATGATTMVGPMNSGGLMIDMAIDADGNAFGHDISTSSIYSINLATGAATLIGPTGISANYAQGMGYDKDNGVLYLAAYTGGGALYTVDTATGAATLVGSFPGGIEVDGLAIPYSGGGGAPKPTVFVKPGTTPVTATVKNVGTFQETDLTAFADIQEFITDPINGTLVYEDDVTGINLNPLGEEKSVSFASYNFAIEGVYKLKVSLPLANDDVQNDNQKTIGIGCDNTKPVTTATITPAAPDGLAGWYVSDVTVKLAATDPTVAGVSSGVDKIEYNVNGAGWTKYTAPFKVTTDNAAHDVKYRAIDKVGNTEDAKTVPVFKIDKTKPVIAMNYTSEKTGMNQYQIIITVTATDAMSGMNKVEFYFNDALQATVSGAGPTYIWNYTWAPLPSVTIKAVAFDNAGLNIFETIVNPTSTATQTQQSQQSHTVVKIL
jgi:hypothetical protein